MSLNCPAFQSTTIAGNGAAGEEGRAPYSVDEAALEQLAEVAPLLLGEARRLLLHLHDRDGETESEDETNTRRTKPHLGGRGIGVNAAYVGLGVGDVDVVVSHLHRVERSQKSHKHK